MSIEKFSKRYPVSVFIITLNEERFLEMVLKMLYWVDEIVVVDSGSNDKTIDIAKQFDAKVVHQDWLGFAKQKQFAMEQCKNDWVLNLDGDEVLTEPLIDKLTNIIEKNVVDGVRIPRNDRFINQDMSAFSKLPTHLRLYKKSLSAFNPEKIVHESATVKGKVVDISEHFDHYGYDDTATLVEKNNKYSCLRAQEKNAKNKQHSMLKLLFIFPLIFLKEVFLQRQIFNGRRGLIKSVIAANYAFIKEAKLYELKQRNK